MGYKSAKLYSTVTVKNGKTQRSYTLVRSSEIDLARSRISEKAPLGKALLNKQAQELVKVETPKGTKKYEIISVE